MQPTLVRTFCATACGLIAALSASAAQAQYTASGYVTNYILDRPTVSPYLNLLRPTGFSGVTNYQTLVRPQLEAREVARFQQAELTRVREQLAVQERTLQSVEQQRAQRSFATGHRTRFMNLQQYYPGFSELQSR